MGAADQLRAMANGLRTVNVEQVCRPVMTKAGANMRDRAKADAPRGNLAGYADTIVFNKPSALVTEMGAKDVGQGPLSSILEYGSGPNAPHPHIIPQLEREAGPTVEYLGKAITDAVNRAIR